MLLLCRWRGWLGLREPRAAGGHRLPRAWPGGTEAHFEQTELKLIWRVKQFLSPPKITTSSDSTTHPRVCVP